MPLLIEDMKGYNLERMEKIESIWKNEVDKICVRNENPNIEWIIKYFRGKEVTWEVTISLYFYFLFIGIYKHGQQKN